MLGGLVVLGELVVLGGLVVLGEVVVLGELIVLGRSVEIGGLVEVGGSTVLCPLGDLALAESAPINAPISASESAPAPTSFNT